MENNLKIINNSFDLYNNGLNYINQFRMFHAYFNTIPCVKSVSNINAVKFKSFILENYQNDIGAINYFYEYEKNIKISRENDYYMIFKNQVVINIYNDNLYVLFESNQEEVAHEIIKNALCFIKRKTKTNEINLIVFKNSNLSTKSIDLKKPKLDIDLHYNNDFKIVHETILKSLKQDKTKALYLFHGLPGTGKSTYIKYLIHQQNKKVIFLSPKTAATLDNTVFTEFLLDNPNVVLVIEDAEELIISRENNQNSQLSFLLNLTDGLIADSLGIQIIATFNTDLKNIDKALLRKGRLTAIYEFKELEFQKANKLLHHLKIENFETLKPMALADIFNYQDVNFDVKKERCKIGF